MPTANPLQHTTDSFFFTLTDTKIQPKLSSCAILEDLVCRNLPYKIFLLIHRTVRADVLTPSPLFEQTYILLYGET